MTAASKSYFHQAGATPLLGKTIPGHFSDIVQMFPDRAAVVSVPEGKRLTYTELAGSVDRLARGLLAMGFRKGDRIGIWSMNNIEWLLLQMATARIGTVLVTINPAYRPRKLAYALQRSAVNGLFSIPFGLLMDRKGGRPVILLGMALMTLGCFLFYFSVTWWLTVGMVFLIGV